MPIRSSDPPRLQSSKRRREYHHILGVIDKNTGGKQAAMAPASSVTAIAKQNGVDEPTNRLQATIDNGDVFRHDGQVCRRRLPDLRAVIAAENDLDGADQDKEKLARLATAVREVRDQ